MEGIGQLSFGLGKMSRGYEGKQACHDSAAYIANVDILPDLRAFLVYGVGILQMLTTDAQRARTRPV